VRVIVSARITDGETFTTITERERKMKIGGKIRLEMDHLFSIIRFSATIAKIEADTVIVRIPERVRQVQWTSFPGEYYRFPKSFAEKAAV